MTPIISFEKKGLSGTNIKSKKIGKKLVNPIFKKLSSHVDFAMLFI